MEIPIGTIIISDDTKDLYRIHFYNNCIKFDIKFAEALAEHHELCRKIVEINEQWAQKEIEREDVMEKIVVLVEGHTEALKDFYFKDYELNSNGKYIDLIPIDSLYLNFDENIDLLYQYLLKEGAFTEITKKEFEKELKEDAYKEIYVDKYSQIHAEADLKFYQYKLNDNFSGKSCCVVGNLTKVFFGYVF